MEGGGVVGRSIKTPIGIRGGWHLVWNLDPDMVHLVNLGTVHTSHLWTQAGYSASWALVSSSINWHNHISFTGRACSQEIQDSGDFVSVGFHLETFSLSLLQSHKRPQTSESRFSDQMILQMIFPGNTIWILWMNWGTKLSQLRSTEVQRGDVG